MNTHMFLCILRKLRLHRRFYEFSLKVILAVVIVLYTLFVLESQS
jgi:hypothetical protein